MYGAALALLLAREQPRLQHGTVAELYGWRVAFYVVGLPGVALALLIRTTVREPVRGAMDGGVLPDEPPSLREVLRFLLARRSFVHMVVGAGFHAFAAMGAGAFYVAYLIRVHGLSVGRTFAISTLLLHGLSVGSAFAI